MDQKPVRIALLISSHRRGGNAEVLAEEALKALKYPAEVDRIWLFEHRIEPFADWRHDDGPPPVIEDDYDEILDRVLAADVLLFAAPVYWYSMPGVLKDFLDRWSGSLRDPKRDFRARMEKKLVYLATMVSDEDRSVARPLIESLKLTARYLGMRWGGVAVGYGSRPGDVLKDKQGMEEARRLFDNLAALLAEG